MAERSQKIRERDVQGLKYFRKLRPLFDRLHTVGCARDRAGNRQLHFDQYCCLVMLFMFNPIVSSLRAMQQASELKNVQRKLGCQRAALGSLSESARVFDPSLLQEVVQELGAQLMPIARDPRLADVQHMVTLVDGTLLKALPRIAEAMWLTTRTGTAHHAWRLHTHFELDKSVPTRMDLTVGRNSGDSDEREVLKQHLQQDRCYVMDRGYAKFTLFNAIHEHGSSYVCRVRDNSVYDVVEDRPLTDEDGEAGVLSDQIVGLGVGSNPTKRPNHPVRLICVQTTPHDKRSNRKGNTGAGPSDGVLRIATNLLDVPASVIALLYRYRFTIEVFFRFFKHVLGCRHLLSDSRRGIEIQVYCAIIACMLISLYTGRKPTLRTYEMVCYYFTGLADEDELLAHIAKLKTQI
ncbi:MAG: IS4 family transposase [Planctomycetota bacterium]